MNILLTGSTGFIGNYVLGNLIKENFIVKIIVRDPCKIPLARHKNITVVKGDLRDMYAVTNAVRDCTHIIHLAALATKWERNPELYYEVNCTGTRNILDIALQYGISKIIYCSTSLSPFLKPGNDKMLNRLPEYVRSKFYSEIIINSYLQSGLDISVVYPTRVFGPGTLNDANSATIVIKEYLRNRFPFIINDGSSLANWAYVKDVAKGIVAALKYGHRGARYNLGGENISYIDFYNLLDELTHKKHLRIKLSYKLASGIARLIESAATSISIKPFITEAWLEQLCDDHSVEIEKSVSDLLYRITPLRNSLLETIKWLTGKK